MPIEDVFTIVGRGVVVTGCIERGTVRVGDSVEIVGFIEENRLVKISGIEAHRMLISEATVGDNVGILLEEMDRADVERGQVLSAPNTVKASAHFIADLQILAEDENSINTSTISDERPQFCFHTANVTGQISSIEIENEKNARVEISLIIPVAIEENMTFTIRYNGKTIAFGIVREFLE